MLVHLTCDCVRLHPGKLPPFSDVALCIGDGPAIQVHHQPWPAVGILDGPNTEVIEHDQHLRQDAIMHDCMVSVYGM